MDVPRKYVDSALGKLNEREEAPAEKQGGAAISQVSSKLGISKGVGAIDVTAFLIAFFTMKETELLCLLTDSQFENLANEYPDGFFSDFTRELTIDNAVNQVAIRAFDAYQLFRYTLSNTSIGFVNPVPDNPE
jgi:hypothetical protein